MAGMRPGGGHSLHRGDGPQQISDSDFRQTLRRFEPGVISHGLWSRRTADFRSAAACINAALRSSGKLPWQNVKLASENSGLQVSNRRPGVSCPVREQWEQLMG